MILRPVSPQSPSGPPMKNLPVGLMCQTVFGGDPALRKRGDHIRTHQRGDLFGGQLLDEMLVRDDDLGRLDRLAVLVAHRDLALGVGAERSFRARMTRLRYLAQDFVRVVERRRHQFGRFAAGIAEHDALIAGALVLVAGGVHALRDVGGLRMQQDLDLRVAPVEPLLLVADVLDRLARRRLDLLVRKVGSADFPRDDHPVGRCESLAGDPDLIGVETRVRPFAEKQIDNFVRNPIANFVRVPLRH